MDYRGSAPALFFDLTLPPTEEEYRARSDLSIILEVEVGSKEGDLKPKKEKKERGMGSYLQKMEIRA